MKWVDDPKYYGPDRRRRNVDPRRPDRRNGDGASVAAPSIAMAIRQLRMRLLDANTPRGLADLRDRIKGIAQLATLQNKHQAAQLLTKLHTALGDSSQCTRVLGQIDQILNRVVELGD
ncbi:MAG: hypothetical protein KF779_09835 [Hyphomonadaceae bacterium]|nr:hypothetical protein [Hyphomonadaceae bacterium]